ncbi:hypothetical protein Vadar_013508 [Vaccinium darrowii]|uniref:Uncharacterized protein n=1 Tax=Vaccinium darrowii TaxID=229202 RepID=A0ACB7XHY6_9ERIC|nr:hypothetical protein Vadar_013508 [Vaccinium darrowii]
MCPRTCSETLLLSETKLKGVLAPAPRRYLLWPWVFIPDALDAVGLNVWRSFFRSIIFFLCPLQLISGPNPTDFTNITKYTYDGIFEQGQINRFENIELNPSAGVLKYGQEETLEEHMASGSDPLTVSLNQMDMDRTLVLLRSCLRTRLQKVTMT